MTQNKKMAILFWLIRFFYFIKFHNIKRNSAVDNNEKYQFFRTYERT